MYIEYIYCVTQSKNFPWFRGEDQDTFILFAEGVDDFCDLSFCLYIDAFCRFVKDNDLGVAGQLTCDYDFLLISPLRLFAGRWRY